MLARPTLFRTPFPTPLPTTRRLVLALLALTSFALQARAATIIDLGPFVPMGINADGVVVGDVIDVDDDEVPGHAAIWEDGILTPLPESPDTELSDAFAISDAGRVVGLEYAGGNVYAVYWDGVAAPTRLTPITEGYDFSQANDVDPAGNVVGTRSLPGTEHPGAGFYDPVNGPAVFVGLGDLPPTKGNTRVRAISGDGTKMLGEIRATDDDGWYIWSTASPASGGIKLDITSPATSPFSLFGASVYGLPLVQNAFAHDGTVLAYRDGAGGRTYFLRAPNGTETPVEGLAGRNAINRDHVVVGTILAGGNLVHAAMWDPVTKAVTDLNTLLPEDSGFILLSATAIAEDGSIAGIAAHDGVQVGFLLKPGDAMSATIEPDPEEPVVGVTFELHVTVTNDGSTPITDVTPPAMLGRTGAGQAAYVSGPTPVSADTLDPNDSVTFVYEYKPSKVGRITFTAQVQATGASGALSAKARCGLGGATLASAVRPAAATCPADGNGTNVEIAACAFELYTLEQDDSEVGLINDDDLTLTKLAADSIPAPGSGYPRGGT